VKKIGQAEIIECLEKNKKAMTGKEIAEYLNQCDKKIYFLLNKLLKWHEIQVKEIPSEVANERYGIKRRLFIYSIKEEWFKNI